MCPRIDLDPDKNIPLSTPPEEIKSPISNVQTIGTNGNSAFAPVTKSQVEPKSVESQPVTEEELSPDKKALTKLSETIGSTCLLRSIIEAEKRPSTPTLGKHTHKEERYSPPAPRREDQGIFDYAAKMRPYYTRASPVPHPEVYTSSHEEKPHEARSLLPPASLLRSLSPDVTLSFPPVFPTLPVKPRSRCSSPATHHEPSHQKDVNISYPKEVTPNQQAPRSPPQKSKDTSSEVFPIPSITVAPEHVTELPKYHDTPGLLAQAMTTAPITPLNLVPFPEPIEIPSMKPLPPETKPVLIRPESPLLNALTVAPVRSYSPLPSVTKPLESLTALSDINKPVNLLLGEKEAEIPPKAEPYSMVKALTIAPARPYSPIPAPPPPAPTPVVHVITDAPFETYVPKLPGFHQPAKKQSAKPENKLTDKTHKSTDPQEEEYQHDFPLTSSGLHIPATIPHYQEHIDEEDIHTKLRNSPLPKTAAQESLTIQSKIMNILSQQETTTKTTAISAEPLKSSALDFLKPKDDSTKIIPTLGYKPNSLIDPNKGVAPPQKEGTQIVHEEKTETIESKTSETLEQKSFSSKTSSYEQSTEKSSQVCQIEQVCQRQDKVCQKTCQSECQTSCLKSKQAVTETSPKVESKSIFEPNVKFERQASFIPKPSEIIPSKTNGVPTSAVTSALSRKLSSLLPSMPDPNPSSFPSNTGSGAGGKGGSSGQTTAPRRGRGILNPQNLTPGARTPLCGQCYQQIR